MTIDPSTAKSTFPAEALLPGLSKGGDTPLELAAKRLNHLEVLLDFQRQKKGELFPMLFVMTGESLEKMPRHPWYELNITEAFVDDENREEFAKSLPCLVQNVHGIAAAIVAEAWTLEDLTSEELADYDEGRITGIYRHMGEHPKAQSIVMVLYQDPDVTVSRTYRVHPVHKGNGLVRPAALDSRKHPEAIAQYGFDMFPLPLGDCTQEDCCQDRQ